MSRLARSILASCLLVAAYGPIRLARADTPADVKDPVFSDYSLETDVGVYSDRRTRGVSDTFDRPGAQIEWTLAHASGLVGVVELGTVSKNEFLNGAGNTVLFAGGYRFGNPDGWHFGIGAAEELFPGARFSEPTGLSFGVDSATGNFTAIPVGFQQANFNTTYGLLEVGWGAIQGRIAQIWSPNYRGLNTGSVCPSFADPNAQLNCFLAGNRNTQGSFLFDVDYKQSIAPRTDLTLHVGYQRVKNFPQLNYPDFAIGVLYHRWNFDFSAQFTTARTKEADLFEVISSSGTVRQADSNALVLGISRKF